MSFLRATGFMQSVRVLALFFVVLGAACERERVKPVLAQPRDLAEMQALVAAEAKRSERWPAWRVTAHLSYKDQELEAGFFLTIKHDRAHAFTRVSIEGSLDQTLWAELIAFGDTLTLYLPLERRVFRGSRARGGSFRASGGIRFSLHEMLLLAELSPALPTNASARAKLLPSGDSILVLARSAAENVRVEFSREGWISALRSFVQGAERVRILYEKRDPATGIARKQTIISPPLKMEAVIWLSSWDPAWRYHTGAEGLLLPEDVLEERM